MDCTYTQNDISPALIGEFVEIQERINLDNSGFLWAIRESTRERLNQAMCNLPNTERELKMEEKDKLFDTLILLSKKMEREIAGYIENIGELQNKNIGIIKISVGTEEEPNGPIFRKAIALFELRYGHNEAQRIVDIFSNIENRDNYFLILLWTRSYAQSKISIQRIHLLDMKAEIIKEKERENLMNKWTKNNGFFKPAG